MLLGGLMFASLLGLTVYLLGVADERSAALRLVNERLEDENSERLRVQKQLRTLAATLERRVAQRTRELDHRVHELEQFAYVASHDLQEPLRMVISYMDLLQKKYSERLGQDAREFIGFAVDGAARMKRLINDLLSFSRLGTRGGAFVACNLNEPLAEALKNLDVAIKESGARIERQPLPTIEADRGQMTQLFQNLLANAIKFRGTQPPVIRVAAAPAEDGYRVSVSDNGIGIDPRFKERIFVIFQRLHRQDEYAGTGIGLAMCKKIADRHNATIEVESEPGRGAAFNVTLPSQHEEDDDVQQAA
jgi:light-regulated signal transduction histidine kinase (bacteriophytochrome)